MGAIQRTRVPESAPRHLRDLRLVSRIERRQPTTPPQRLRMPRVTALALRVHRPDRMQFAVLAEQVPVAHATSTGHCTTPDALHGPILVRALLSEGRRPKRDQRSASACSRRSISSASLSAGVAKPSVLRGRRLSFSAISSRCSWPIPARLVPFGKYWRSRPLVFSFEPRCQGLWGSQK